MRPLVAAVGDGHTTIGLTSDAAAPRRFGLRWDVVARDLYVAGVLGEADRPLLGARLAALGGVAAGELAARLARLRGCDNEYQVRTQLALAFDTPDLLADLLDPAAPLAAARLTLTRPDGARVDVPLAWVAGAGDEAIRPAGGLAPPALNAARLGWAFLDRRGDVACLRVASLRHYREAFEVHRSTGYQGFSRARLASIAAAARGGPAPADVDDQIAAVPAATDLIGAMVAAMREAGTTGLIVDLRECDGGNSFLTTILGHALYGTAALLRAAGGYQIRRYSPLYFANYAGARDDAPAEALACGGYDFSEERAWRARRAGPTDAARAAAEAAFARDAAQAPTFARAYARGETLADRPPRVVALTSAWTYSAGFDVAAMLVGQGAAVVGVPSAPARNCFIDILRFRLDHSGLDGTISFKWSLLFPDDAERGRVLRPERELTYADLAARAFDPQAALALALAHLRAEGP